KAPSLVSLYRWLDTVPLSRPRRNIARDFSDGVLAAEVVKFFFPSLVELHGFVPASSTAQKVANWGHLNRKVLAKLNLRVPEETILELARGRAGAAERLLLLLRDRIQERQRERKGRAGQVRESLRNSRELGCARKAGEGLGPRPGGTGHREWEKGTFLWNIGQEFLTGVGFPANPWIPGNVQGLAGSIWDGGKCPCP
uniref:Sperm flagellar 1 n=1 Tax=Cyanoderma ruficeps TaxID=181631 RepID=A0A8C3R894_9PASS